MKTSQNQICKGGPLDGIQFTLFKDDKTEIQAGDGRPGTYRRTEQLDSQNRRIWKHFAPSSK